MQRLFVAALLFPAVIAACHIDTVVIPTWPSSQCSEGLEPTDAFVDTGLGSGGLTTASEFDAMLRHTPDPVLPAEKVLLAEEADAEDTAEEPALVEVPTPAEPESTKLERKVSKATSPTPVPLLPRSAEPPQAQLTPRDVTETKVAMPEIEPIKEPSEEPKEEILATTEQQLGGVVIPTSDDIHHDVPEVAPAPLEGFGLPIVADTKQGESEKRLVAPPADAPPEPEVPKEIPSEIPLPAATNEPLTAVEIENLKLLGVNEQEMRIMEWEAHMSLAAKILQQIKEGNNDPELRIALRFEVQLAGPQPQGATLPEGIAAHDPLLD